MGSAALMMTSAAMAQEEVIEPQIGSCEVYYPLPVVVDEIVTEDNVTVVEEFTEREVSEDGGDVVVDAPEVSTDDDVVFICRTFDLVKRENDDVSSPEYLAVTTSGPTMAESSGTEAQPSAPQAADEQSTMTQVEKKTVSSQISRVACKPTAVKSDGRVFLR